MTMQRTAWRLGFGALLAAALTCRGEGLQVLCTTFPIRQITRHVVAERDGVKLALLLPASLGCPHHYALTPRDMRQLASADVLIVNGLGMEDFLGAPIRKAHPRLRVIDSTAGIVDTLPLGETPACSHGHDHADACAHAHNANPHLFASPLQAGRLAGIIAAGLAAADPDGAAWYRTHAERYAARMNALTAEMRAQVATLNNRRIVQPHGVFDYLARDIGLEIVAVLQPEGRSPSAAEMRGLMRRITTAGAGAIFSEPQYPSRVGQTLARETGIPFAMLDPVASGPDDAPLDYFERVMRENMETLRATLGTRP